MKKIGLLLIVLIISTFLLFGCFEEPNTNTQNNIPDNSTEHELIGQWYTKEGSILFDEDNTGYLISNDLEISFTYTFNDPEVVIIQDDGTTTNYNKIYNSRQEIILQQQDNTSTMILLYKEKVVVVTQECITEIFQELKSLSITIESADLSSPKEFIFNSNNISCFTGKETVTAYQPNSSSCTVAFNCPTNSSNTCFALEYKKPEPASEIVPICLNVESIKNVKIIIN